MRRIDGAIVTTLTALLVASPAHAQHPAGGSTHSNGPSSGGASGGSSPGGTSSGGTTAPGTAVPDDSDVRAEVRADGGIVRPTLADPRRFYEIGASVETHALLWQNNLGGAGANRLFNYYDLYAHVDFLGPNRILAYLGAYQRFLADPGESGMRLDDAYLLYARYVPLGPHFVAQARASLAFPTSFESQKMSLYVEPTLGAQLSGRFLDGALNVDVRAFGSWYFTRYREYEGGDANPKARLGFLFASEMAMPFHRRLSLGMNVYVAYYWYYGVANGAPEPGQPQPSGDPQFARQPVQLVYGGELFARYTFPRLLGVLSDLRVAIAQGDTTLGFTSLIHDGISNLYVDYYRSTEIYGAFSIRY